MTVIRDPERQNQSDATRKEIRALAATTTSRRSHSYRGSSWRTDAPRPWSA